LVGCIRGCARASSGHAAAPLRRFAIAPMMEWTDRAEKQSFIST
jgi:hypothetical protein